MADTLPKNTADLLSEIDREWLKLMKVVEKLTPDQMTMPDSGGWSPKDNLAHLAAWMHFMQESYINKKPAPEVMEMDAATYSELDEDGINARIFERNRNRTTPDVLAGLMRSYGEVVETLRKIPFSDLMNPLRDNDPEKRPLLLSVLGNTSEHFVEHRQIIERSLKK
jgi:hypothetical protein